PVLAINHPDDNHPGTVGPLLKEIEHALIPVNGIAEGGRLCVRGQNIMLGYLDPNHPDSIAPPRVPDLGVGWYDTGDIVALEENGAVRIQGRAKRFIKVGGEMISLSAVEMLAASLWPDHQHAALPMPPLPNGENTRKQPPFVLFTATEIDSTSQRTLARHAKEHGWSPLMVPKRLVHCAEIPLLGSGKVDHVSLMEEALRLLETD
ncbi:MAG: AMP-binding protein, partial [Magnetococcales bacterium]|nr:AMP-binding protein [Magnetococcales bacterium]